MQPRLNSIVPYVVLRILQLSAKFWDERPISVPDVVGSFVSRTRGTVWQGKWTRSIVAWKILTRLSVGTIVEIALPRE